jgi:SAM-dependent methyltransferase
LTSLYPAVFARFYDLIYHQVRDDVDHDHFIGEISRTKGKILEIGAGTGRFFLDALKRGADIQGIDISPAMVSILTASLPPGEHHRISVQGIRDFVLHDRFDLIVAPFRVFMHITDKTEQLQALNNVFLHLAPGGRFIFDTFIPDPNYLIKGFDNHTDFEGEYEPGKKVRRIVTTRPDLVSQVIGITFRFEWEEEGEWKSESWETSLRFFFRYELEHLLERSAFPCYEIRGDYAGNELSSRSKEFVVTCRKQCP